MLKRILPFISAVAIAFLAITAVQAYEVPDKITIVRPAGNKKLNTWVKEVKFPHGFHAINVACKKCHHKESGKTLGEFVPCRECHVSDDPNDKSGFYRAWHSDGPPSCLGCHTQMRTKGGKNPVGCTTACHKPG
ncbi:cytochrome c3 family protein [Maridesulfovibrio bastinii]|jgi:hypothetical protein|uniref:cytochrome c3 family protein n=1 Tax=Maridesulfovibrio bastinii TaxID=47157 RepID=UPI0004005D57|nr:cytochrome c3 family protein [Maridesulfovibrio bastinii]